MLAQTPQEEARWAAVVARDRAADGRFVYSVRTTGVYCRPSCAARLARRENVAFHETPAQAEAAGFRPCKRCRPTETSLAERYGAAVAQACRTMEAAETPPTLDELAREAGLSPHHFHRVFKSVAGVTPKAYADACRAKRVRAALAEGAGVTEALYEAGFNSSGRFYAQSGQVLGMTPSRFRAGGARAKIRFAVGQCSLGALLVAATEKGVCAIQLGEDPEVLVRELQDRFAQAELVGGDPAFEATVARVAALVEAPGQGLDLPLDIRGTAFQQRVWRALCEIPAGRTASYAEIAAAIGAPKAVRAVAGACAANELAVAIPCHRVVRTDGALSGYRWGVERKAALLAREAAA
ncbi:MAG: bifunctional DNA-binding transcriptional regulator/O6-methylguanine-DNA methyltransferase Ada [Phenylobacterium sp.]|uniref:bifunctional DNA-binding transcriptional regulator/O6-methylguanine-DNA methyltransferase Ada n=1 Tax=Phenylobacterium sp. TaxID=1871053 RepID=UPI00391BB07F